VRENVREGGEAAFRLAAGTPLKEAFDTSDPYAWTALDLGVRAWLRVDTRREIRARVLGLPAGPLRRRPAPPDAPVLAVALCHHDGRVREAALLRLLPDHPELLPLAVVRAADWADPVRDRARDLLRTALDTATAVALAPLILLVGRRARGGFAVQLLTDALRRTPRDGLLPLLRHERPAVRRFAYRLAVGEGILSPAELARAAARDTDVVVQDLCAEAALAGVREGRAAYDDVLPPLLEARHPRARSAGVTALRAAGRVKTAEAFLTDRSALVRACARYVVRQGGGDSPHGSQDSRDSRDPRETYLALCARSDDPALPPGAVIGLAECGRRADAALLEPLLAHPSAGVRARAVAGLRLLDAVDAVDAARLRDLLDDPAPGVAREAVAALLPSAGALPEEWLARRLAAGRSRPVRAAAFRLLVARGGVVGLRAAVALLDDPDDRLRHWARQTAQRWHATDRGNAEVGELLARVRARGLFSDHVFKRRMWEAGLRA
jgi:hypothetical protein